MCGPALGTKASTGARGDYGDRTIRAAHASNALDKGSKGLQATTRAILAEHKDKEL